MKPRDWLFRWQFAFGASFLVVLNLLAVSNALAATTGPSNPLVQDRARLRIRPSDLLIDSHGRQPNRHRLASLALTLPASQPNVSAAALVTNSPTSLSIYDQFVASVRNGQTGVVRGVFVPGVLAMRVVQQPVGNPNYVSLAPRTATQYGPAAVYGVTGLLADDAGSGPLYYSLSVGQEVRLILGDGSARLYQVAGLYRYRALSPNDPYSNFVDLSSGDMLSAVDLFGRMYSGGNHITFQTCIAQEGVLSWGRLFVIATPQ